MVVSSDASLRVKYDFPSFMICDAKICFISPGAPRWRYVIR